MRDLKYILKRILIGVGIVLLLSFIRGYKVKALEDVDVSWLNAPDNVITSDDKYQLLAQSGTQRIYKHRDNGTFAFCWASYTQCDLMKPSDYFDYNYVGLQIKSTSSAYYDIAYFTNNGALPTMNSGPNFTPKFNSSTFQVILLRNNSLSNTPSIYTQIGNTNENGFRIYTYPSYFDYFANTNWNNGWKTTTLFEFLPPTASSIISLQPTIVSNNNVITGYIFRPKFSNFNLTNYDYQYKFGNGTTWLGLDSNEKILRINSNGTLYVRIKNKNNNEIVDTITYTITNLGSFYDNVDYNITYSGEYRTNNYLNNNISSKTQSIIEEYQIYVDYFPKTSILKYQYQYVSTGSSLDDNNWNNVSSLDNGSFTYVASENGTLYARILDKDDNVLFSNSFVVDSIGLLALDSNIPGVNNFLTKLRDKINYGGPVSTLFNVPISFLSSIYMPISNSDTCTNLSLGNLLGTNLSLPCVNIRRYLGNNVYNIIDLIFSFFLILGIIKMCINIYNKFISMKDINS